jgi:multiple sugar transport system substrate-binding protein
VLMDKTPRRLRAVAPRIGQPVRRSAAMGVALVAAAGALAGCGATSSDSGGKVQLTMWQQWGGGHERQDLDSLIGRYEKLHPNVAIKETPVTNNAKILASITGGNPPDIVSLGNSLPLGSWAGVGAVTDLGPYIKSSKLDTSMYIPSTLKAMTVDGKIYGLPFQAFNAGLIYNKKLFAEAGLKPPTTLEELAKDAKLLTKTDASGKITQLGFAPNYPGPDQGQTCPLISYGYGFGGSWFGQNGTPTPNTAANIAALAWEKAIYDAAGTAKVQNFISSAGSYLTGGDPLESGKLAMMFDGPWSIQYTKDNAPSVAADLAVIPLPASSTSPSSAGSTYIDANAQIIPRGAHHAKEAFDFIEWMSTNANETATFSNAVANIPQLKKVPNYSLLDNANYKKYVSIANGSGARSWVQTSSSSTYGTNLCQAQDAVLLNGQNPAAALSGVKTQ